MSLVKPYIRRYLAAFTGAVAFLTVESVCDLLQPTILARMIDTGVAARDSGEVLRAPGSEAGAGAPVASPGGRSETTTEGGALVELLSVSFAYPAAVGRLVLEGVDLTCEPGRITAIIGPTGSGKSTLAALVPRFYDPTSGEVRVGGVPVQRLELVALRQRVALVPQQTVLFT